MSFQEKSTWLMGIVVLAVYGWYFTTVMARLESDGITEVGYKAMLGVTVVALVVLAAVGHILIAVIQPAEAGAEDQRDKEINRFGEYIGGYVLGVGAVSALGLAVFEFDHFWIANAILLALVVSELVSAGVKVVAYRRGF